MPILNPEHLFEQADRLIQPGARGRSREVDTRRAISAAYYGVFHATMTEAADLFVGRSQRNTARYALVYRGADHRALARLCEDVRKAAPPAKYARYLQADGFGANLRQYAGEVVELQDRRHAADYDPMIHVLMLNAMAAVGRAREAVVRFRAADAATRETFLTLLLFPPR